MRRTCVATGQVPLPTPSLATRSMAAMLGTVVARRQERVKQWTGLAPCDLVSRLEAPGQAQPEKSLEAGWPRTWHCIACPPGAPTDETEGALAVSCQLMQRIDRRSRDWARLRNEKVRGRIPAAPPQRSAGDLRKYARGLARTRVCLTSVPPADCACMPRNTCKEAHGYEKVAHGWTRRRSASGPTLNRNRQNHLRLPKGRISSCAMWPTPADMACEVLRTRFVQSGVDSGVLRSR
jgi:hypothetical protein